ncbi:MAG: PrsW family glutamic-type intramembrane protease [Planctomycetota bacterium]
MNDKHFSVDHEPALSGEPGRPDPAEHRSAPAGRPPDELEALRDSVAAEPALPDRTDPAQWTRWIERKRAECSTLGSLGVTLLAAVLGGPFAILGAVLSGQQGAGPAIYLIVVAPVIEEWLKQSGMTFVLANMPYRVFASWQFVFAGVISGLAFGVIENLVYMGRFAAVLSPQDLARLTAYRWAMCTPLHVVCAAIASLGLVRVWKKQCRDGRPADLAAAFPFFVAAMVIHGVYNFSAVLFGPRF